MIGWEHVRQTVSARGLCGRTFSDMTPMCRLGGHMDKSADAELRAWFALHAPNLVSPGEVPGSRIAVRGVSGVAGKS